MSNILNRYYIKYGEVEDESKEVSKEAPKTTSAIDKSLNDYNIELDIEDFSDDNWSENVK